MKKILATLLLTGASVAYAQTNVTVSYGSAFAGSDGSIFADASGTGFDAGNAGLIAFGWSDGFSGGTTVADYLADFNVLGSLNFDSVGAAGYNPGTGSFDNDTAGAAGKTGYWFVLKGVTDFANAANADEIGIFNDSGWTLAPAGSLTGDSWSIASVFDVDNVVFGNQGDGGFGTGTSFLTAEVIPESSTYAALAGLCALGAVMVRRRRA